MNILETLVEVRLGEEDDFLKDTVATVFLNKFCKGSYTTTYLRVDGTYNGEDD